jgi:dolichol-phosphate mannosyltransferase
MTNAAKTLVMTATYNEIENLPRLLDEVFAVVPDADFLVVDDNSPDGTGEWCDQQAASDRRVHCIHRAGKLGLGSAIVAGMKYAIEHGYRYVLNMDADFSHHPRYLPAMISGMEPPDGHPVDVMIGSRYVPGGGTVDWPLRRRLMSRAVNAYARWMLWLSARDCSGGYRCYRVATLARLDLDAIRSRGYSFQEEILWMLRRAGAQIGETPILFADREHGQSKINSREALSALRIIATLGVKNLAGK